MSKRTPKQIQFQIDGLKREKKNITEHSGFGNNNWEVIDAKLDILEDKQTLQDFEDPDVADDFEDVNNVIDGAQQAEDWLNGDNDEDLFDEMWANQKD